MPRATWPPQQPTGPVLGYQTPWVAGPTSMAGPPSPAFAWMQRCLIIQQPHASRHGTSAPSFAVAGSAATGTPLARLEG